MPRRRALLVFLFAVLTYATTPAPGNENAPVKIVVDPHPDVFIPLKEWKRQRLQDIESRVRKAEEKLTSTTPRRFAVCKPRARLLAFLSRVDVCPPSSPSTTLNSSSNDPDLVSAKHTSADVNSSAESTETAPSKDVQPVPEPAARPSVVKDDDSSDPPEKLEVASVQPSPDAIHEPSPIASIEPDELTGRIEDYIPKVLPNVLPKVIPKVGEIVKSLKEVSLSYATSGETPPDSLNPKGKTSHSGAAEGNNTGNATSQHESQKKSGDPERNNSQSIDQKPSPKSSNETFDKLFEDEHMLSLIVKHNNDSGVKEKPFNYASIDAGARVLAVSDGVVGATNVIQGSNDKYLLSPCAGSGIAGSRFVDLELSEEVILESVETANFEYYSSSPRKIAILGASTYPPKKWNVLGIFDFANVKTLQKFQIEKRGVTRYLRVIFAGKQGTEYYCPISTIRAFGKNLLADWKEVLEKPPSTMKPLIDTGGGSKSKMDKEPDRAKNGNAKNSKKVETKPSEKVEKCVGDTCQETTDMPTVSESPTIPSEEDKGSMQPSEDTNIQRDNGDNVGTGAELQDKKVGNENDIRTGDDIPDSDVKREGTDRKEGEIESDGTASDEDKSALSQASYGESDHVSEDDQVVIDALRSDALSPVDGDDNIFRKVTRMLRLLELNQTLTNQYIDTQLAKFAIALSDAHSNSKTASERVKVIQGQLEILVVQLENHIEEVNRANFRRDVLLCVLIVCVAFLLGTHWILWSAVSSTRIHEEPGLRRTLDREVESIDCVLQTDDISLTAVTRVDGISSEGPSPAGKKKKKKGRKPFAGENMNGGYFSGNKLPRTNGMGSANVVGSEGERFEGRSVSSLDLRSDGRRRYGSTGGTFDILRRMTDQ